MPRAPAKPRAPRKPRASKKPKKARIRMPNQLGALRADRDLSMAELAAMVFPRTTAGTIEKLENGEMGMTLEWMYKLATALDCHASELLPDASPITLHEKSVIDKLRRLPDADTQRRLAQVIDVFAEQSGGEETPIYRPPDVKRGVQR